MAFTTPPASPLERLPCIVLDRICEFVDDDSDNRSDLWALSLTSRRCSAATDARRFCQIIFRVPSLDEIGSVLEQLKTVLGHGRRYGLVRRLRVQGVQEAPRKKERWEQMFEEREEGEDEDDLNALLDREKICRKDDMYFAAHPFCRLSHCLYYKDENLYYKDEDDRPEVWQPFAEFLRELPSVCDLVWSGKPRLPRSVLDAVHQRRRRCRLHTALFLPSMLYSHAHPQSISEDDYALITSPSLVSVYARFNDFHEFGDLNYTQEVLQRMMNGLSPSLEYLVVKTHYISNDIRLNRARALGRPPWRGFFIKGDGNGRDEGSIGGGTGSLRNLTLGCSVEPQVFNSRSMANLRSLHLHWSLEVGLALADLAVCGHLSNLEMLWLVRIYSSSKQSQEAVNQILGYTKPLRRLGLLGCFYRETFDIITRHHGPALRSLSLSPEFSGRFPPDGLFSYSPDTLQQVAECCPNLETLVVDMDRTRGDRREVAMYRALSQLPRLRRLRLNLHCHVDSRMFILDDAEAIDGESNLPHIQALRETFTNCATDAALSRAIFDLISREGRGALQYLHIEPRARYTPYFVRSSTVLSILMPSWVCQAVDVQSDGSRVAVHRFDNRGLRDDEEDSDDDCWPSWHATPTYVDLMRTLWPGNKKWWKCWSSLPLET